MKILLAFIHWPVSSGTFLKRAFARLGHDARSVGPCSGRGIWGIEVPEEYVQQPDLTLNWQVGQPFPDMGLVEGLGEWQPDLIVTSDSTFTITGRAACPHVLLGQDNHVRNYRNLEAEGAEFDALFMAHSWGARIGEPNVFWCPPAYDPQACTDLGQPRPLDACLIGYPYADRMAMRAAFQEAGLNSLFAIGILWDRYNAAYNQSKIALVRSIKGDVPNRFLEGMAQGCCVLSDRLEDAEAMGFMAGVDYWPYKTTEDAVREAKFVLETGIWETIAANGQRKVAGHSWDARAMQILETVFQPIEKVVS